MEEWCQIIEKKVLPFLDPLEKTKAEKKLTEVRKSFARAKESLARLTTDHLSLLLTEKGKGQACACGAEEREESEGFMVCLQCGVSEQIFEKVKRAKSQQTDEQKIKAKVTAYHKFLEKNGLPFDTAGDYGPFLSQTFKDNKKPPNLALTHICLCLRGEKEVGSFDFPTTPKVQKSHLDLIKEVFEALGWEFPAEAMKEFLRESYVDQCGV